MQRLHFSILDNAIGEKEMRFSAANISFIAALEALVPSSENFLKQKSIESFVKLVPISDAVYQETVVAKPMLLEHASD